MAKKVKCNCPPPGAPMWMATFGDMMSLLLTFFILLVSFSSIQETKFHEAVGSLQGALGVLSQLPKVPVKMDIDKPTKRGNMSTDELGKRVAELKEKIAELQENGKSVSVGRSEKGLAIRLDDQTLFDPGKADLRQSATEVLSLVAGTLAEFPNAVRIEGHTDNLPINTEQFPSNWELSAARAAAVLRFFQEHGLDPRRMSAVGMGEWRPLASNDSVAERQRNRRVEIFMESKVEQRPMRLGDHF